MNWDDARNQIVWRYYNYNSINGSIPICHCLLSKDEIDAAVVKAIQMENYSNYFGEAEIKVFDSLLTVKRMMSGDVNKCIQNLIDEVEVLGCWILKLNFSPRRMHTVMSLYWTIERYLYEPYMMEAPVWAIDELVEEINE